jgi:hypothetical protein
MTANVTSAALWIRIQISRIGYVRTFGRPGSGSIVICTDTDPVLGPDPDLGQDSDPSIINQKRSKNRDFYCFVTSSD